VRCLSITAALGLLFLSSSAEATLTDSEKAQIRDFYAKGDAVNAPRVRALLARPDLTPPEAGAMFAEATRRVPFDDKHQIFVKDLLFGPATAASRSELVPPVVSGLLARAAEVLGGVTADDVQRAQELMRIHRFVGREIASGGKPPREGHDGSISIRDDSLRAVVADYRAHLTLPIFDPARLTGTLPAARAQAELTLLELASGLHATSDVASWITADAPQRAALEKSGVLVVGLGGAPPAKASAVVSMLASVAPAAQAASALWIGKPWPHGLASRREVLVAQAPLTGTRKVQGSRMWSSAVDPSTPDAALAEVAFVLGRAADSALSAADPAFAAMTQGALDRARAGGDGAFLAVESLVESLEATETSGTSRQPAVPLGSFVGRSVELLLLDAPRALSVALVRSLSGKNEPMEQFCLALYITALGEGGKLKDSVTLGRPGDAGGVAPIEITKIRGTGFEIDHFTVDGHEYAVSRAPGGAVSKVERDSRPLALSAIPHTRIPTVGGETWTLPANAGARGPRVPAAPTELRRLFGHPEVGFVDDGRTLVRSAPGSKGRDAVVAKGPAEEIELELDLSASGSPGAVVLRASAGATSYAGIALFVEPGDAPRAWVVALDGSGGKFPLTNPTPLAKPTAKGHHVKAALKRDGVQVWIGDRAMTAALPNFLIGGGGDVAFAPGEPGEIEVRNLRLAPLANRKK